MSVADEVAAGPVRAGDRHERARERFRAVFPAHASAVLMDEAGTTVDALGSLASVVPGDPLSHLAQPADRPLLDSWVAAVRDGAEPAAGGTFTTVLGDRISARLIRVVTEGSTRIYLVAQLELLQADVEQLRHHERVYRLWFEQAPTGMALVATDGRFLDANPAFCSLIDRPPELLRVLRFQDITHPDDLLADVALLEQTLVGELDRYELDKRYVTGAGAVVWAHLKVVLVRDEAGEPLHFIAMVSDITDRKRTEAQLQSALRHSAEAFDAGPTPALQVGADGRVLRSNRAARTLTGRPGEALLRLADAIHPGDVPSVDVALRQLTDPHSIHRSCDLAVRDRAGRKRHLSAALFTSDGQGPVLLVQLAEGTDGVRMRELEHAANHDHLTGLANRAHLEGVLAATLGRSVCGHVALLFIDLDGFKQVNDQLGHIAGDGLLVAVAARLRSACRPQDLVARIGGDEFAVVLPGTDEAVAHEVAGRIARELDQVRAGSLAISATIGVAVTGPAAPSGVEDLLCAADEDLYRRRGSRP